MSSIASNDEVDEIKRDDVVTAIELADDLIEKEDEEMTPGWMALFSWRRKVQTRLDATATVRSVFDNPEIAKFYWPHDDYENLHRFDPNARWTVGEEIRVRNKTDWRIFLWILVMFFGLNIDRGNLASAVADNLLDDMKLTTNDYNNAQNMYRIGFLLAEIPSQMIGKWLGPDRWIPIQIMLWSVAAAGQFWMHNRQTFFACRFLIGIFMGGFIPDSILYLSYFYKTNEMPLRLSLFWFVDTMSGVIASFISYGVFHMTNVDGREGWRWLFLFEALISFVIGLLSLLFLVPGPTQTKTWWNPKGYYTEREETIIVSRVIRDDPSKGQMHNREPITLKMLWSSLKDYDLWPLYIIGILFEIPTSPPKSYLTLSLKELKFSTFQTTLLQIPVSVFGAINLVVISIISEYVQQISYVGLFTSLWSLPLLIVQYTSGQKISPWGQYVLSFFLIGYPSPQAALVSWCSRLSNSIRTRAVSAAMFNITIQLSGIASSNIYRADDAPRYLRGNKQLIAINVSVSVAYILAKFYYRYRNQQKAKVWDAMNSQEKAQYLEENEHLGNKRLDFRFDH